MGACRESTNLERKLEKFLTQIRTVDKVLWSYSGKNIEQEQYPLSSFTWIEEELDDAHRLWMELMDEKHKERRKVIELNNKKFPPNLNDKVSISVLQDSVTSASIPNTSSINKSIFDTYGMPFKD
jgi:hypothetical protein